MAANSRMHITAKFVGEDGSMGYRHGDIYDLTIEGNEVVAPHPCPYTVAGFLQNWVVFQPDGTEPDASEYVTVRRSSLVQCAEWAEDNSRFPGGQWFLDIKAALA